MTKKEIALESDGDEMKLLDNSDIDRKEVEIIVGDIIILTDVPSNIYNAVINNLGTSTKIDGNELSCHIANFLRLRIPPEKRPPSENQTRYAKDIASILEIPLPCTAMELGSACSDFIDKNIDQYKETLEEHKKDNRLRSYLLRQSGRVERWSLAKARVDDGESIELVAEHMGVKPPTIEKYCKELENWVNFASNDEIDIVMTVINFKKMGGDPYALTYEELIQIFLDDRSSRSDDNDKES